MARDRAQAIVQRLVKSQVMTCVHALSDARVGATNPHW